MLHCSIPLTVLDSVQLIVLLFFVYNSTAGIVLIVFVFSRHQNMLGPCFVREYYIKDTQQE